MKNELKRSLVDGDTYRTEDLAKRADNIYNYEEADPVVKEYETINRWQKKNILNARLNQGCIFKKFKEFNKFAKCLRNLKSGSLQYTSGYTPQKTLDNTGN